MKADRESNKYKNVPDQIINNEKRNWTDIQWTNMTDEHFMVWMRAAGLPNFRKLYGRIE